MEVRWTRRALQALSDYAEYVAEDSPQAARGLMRRVGEAVALASTQPAMGRPGRAPRTRELVVTGTPLILPYRVRGGTLEILAVLQGAQRWPESF